MTTSTRVGTVPAWTVGDRLRKARELTGLDAKAFAADMGIARNTVTKYEHGDTLPRPIILRAWALRCGVSDEWLATGAVHPDPPFGDGLSSERRNDTTVIRPTNLCLSVAGRKIRAWSEPVHSAATAA